jgi:hypothetical protein
LNTTGQQFVTTYVFQAKFYSFPLNLIEVNSIWSIDCNGEIRAGVTGDVEFFFTVDSDGTTIIANSVSVNTAGIARSLGKRATRMRLKAVPITAVDILEERSPKPRRGRIVKGPLHPLPQF